MVETLQSLARCEISEILQYWVVLFDVKSDSPKLWGVSLCSLWLPFLEESLDDRFGTTGQGCVDGNGMALGLERPGSGGPGGLLLG